MIVGEVLQNAVNTFESAILGSNLPTEKLDLDMLIQSVCRLYSELYQDKRLQSRLEELLKVKKEEIISKRK